MLAPFLGGLLFYIFSFLPFILGLVILPVAPVFGVGFAVAAFLRQERYSALPWIGLIFNLAVGCCVCGMLSGWHPKYG